MLHAARAKVLAAEVAVEARAVAEPSVAAAADTTDTSAPLPTSEGGGGGGGGVADHRGAKPAPSTAAGKAADKGVSSGRAAAPPRRQRDPERARIRALFEKDRLEQKQKMEEEARAKAIPAGAATDAQAGPSASTVEPAGDSDDAAPSSQSPENAKLLVRQTDGTSFTTELPGYATLADAHAMIAARRTDARSAEFGLVCVSCIPRRRFRAADYTATAEDLQLCPTATLVISSAEGVPDDVLAASAGRSSAAAGSPAAEEGSAGLVGGVLEYVGSWWAWLTGSGGSGGAASAGGTPVTSGIRPAGSGSGRSGMSAPGAPAKRTPARAPRRQWGARVAGIRSSEGGRDGGNQYWGGDSTVFEGRGDAGSDGDSA